MSIQNTRHFFAQYFELVPLFISMIQPICFFHCCNDSYYLLDMRNGSLDGRNVPGAKLGKVVPLYFFRNAATFDKFSVCRSDRISYR
jgi:hypothetical protein